MVFVGQCCWTKGFDSLPAAMSSNLKVIPAMYTPYEGFISTNQNDRKLDAYDRKFKGSHNISRYFYEYLAKINRIRLEHVSMRNEGVWHQNICQ